MKQYLISEEQLQKLVAIGGMYKREIDFIFDLKPITRLTDERIEHLWWKPSNGVSPKDVRADFARAIERELLGGEL